jgi:hypothetical protein
MKAVYCQGQKLVLTEVRNTLLIWTLNLILIQLLIQILLEVVPSRMAVLASETVVAAVSEVWVSVMVANADWFEVARTATTDPDPAPSPLDDDSDAGDVPAGVVSVPRGASVVPLGGIAPPILAAAAAAHDGTSPPAIASVLVEPVGLNAVEVLGAVADVAVGMAAEQVVEVAVKTAEVILETLSKHLFRS